jgi:hypothetical protein
MTNEQYAAAVAQAAKQIPDASQIYVPPGFTRIIGREAERDRLATGERRAFGLIQSTGDMLPLPPELWRTPKALDVFRSGYLAGYYTFGEPVLVVLLDEPQAQTEVAAPKGRSGRPKGTGKQTTDALLVKRMHELLSARKANSRTEAAKMTLDEDGNHHGASHEASVSRLVKRYAETYGE